MWQFYFCAVPSVSTDVNYDNYRIPGRCGREIKVRDIPRN